MASEDDYLMLSGIQHFIFCRRQWALIHIEQQWKDNELTIEGDNLHSKTDDPFIKEKRKNKITVRAMPVQSRDLEITGICDVVEFEEDSTGVMLDKYKKSYRVIPVEFKRGKKKKDLSDEMQLVAQAICLEEMLVTEIPVGYLFYFETKKREEIQITDEKRNKLYEIMLEMQQYWKKKYTPKVKESAKCKRCSLLEICIPALESKQSVNDYLKRRLAE